MESLLDKTAKDLREGEIIDIGPKDYVFKLSSYKANPIIRPSDLGLTWYENGKLKTGAIFNGGAEVFQEKIILLPRCHKGYKKGVFFDEKLGIKRTILENYISQVWVLESDDGIHFRRFNNVVIKADGSTHKDFTYGIEDIRIIKYEDRYILIGCGKTKPPFKGGNADRVAVYSTKNFKDISYHGIIDTFDSRNAVLFFDKSKKAHYMLLRFHPNIHLVRLDEGVDHILFPSKYKAFWKKVYEQRQRNILLEASSYPHEKEKIGPGPQVILTNKGFLVLYHAVGEIDESLCKAYGMKGKIERGYSICAALLEPDKPSKVICRTKYPIYIPSFPYELYGDKEFEIDVPCVIFPVGAVLRQNRLFIYAGAADKYIVLLSCDIEFLVDYLWRQCKI